MSLEEIKVVVGLNDKGDNSCDVSPTIVPTQRVKVVEAEAKPVSRK